MDDLDREQYLTRRLPKPDNHRGPTREWQRYLEIQAAKIHRLPQRESTAVDEQREAS